MSKPQKQNIIFTNKDERPSRFLVDLNGRKNEEKDEQDDFEKKKSKFGFSFFGARKKKNQINEKENGKSGEEVIYSEVKKDSSKNRYFNKFKTISTNLKKNSWYVGQEDRFKRLAFLSIISFTFKTIFKISFKVGWLVIFVFKFIYFLFLFFLRLINRLFNFKLLKFNKTTGKDMDLAVSDAFDSKKNEAESNFFVFSEENSGNGNEVCDKKNTFAGLFEKFKLKRFFPFFLILFVLVLPFKAFTYYNDLSTLRSRVLGASEDAINDIKGATDSISNLKFDEASDSFVKAGDNFFKAQEEIGEISGIISFLGSVVPSDDLKLAKNGQLILEAGVLSSKMGEHMTLAMASLNKDDFTIKDFVNDLHFNSKEASTYARELKDIVGQIDPKYLPDDYADKFVEIEDKADLVIGSLGELADFLDEMKTFLGFDIDKRYLLVFQNNTEMRGSGGFIGSYALVDIANGGIKKIEVPGGGSYDTEGGLYERIVAPEPLHLVNPLWHFWDANWWPDWPTTAKKLEWFLERSNGPTVDGVISFTPTVLEGILEAMGPVDMTEKYGVVITSENFWEVTQEIVERKEDSSVLSGGLELASTTNELASTTPQEEIKNEPKKIIGDLTNKILEELPSRLNKDVMLSIIGVFEKNLDEKHVLLYFNEKNLEKKAAEFGWDGSVKQSNWDYLMVVNTNIAGQKTDREISEEISHSVKVSANGSIVDTVVIKRTHTGNKGDAFTGVRNVNWMRVYVPEGSKLLSAQGFNSPDEKYFESPDESWTKDPDVEAGEGNATIDLKTGTKIYNENGKTVFANWTMLDPGKTLTIILKYEIPVVLEEDSEISFGDKIQDFLNPSQKELIPYAILFQKQPGSIGSILNSELILPNNFKKVWQYSDIETSIKNGWNLSSDLREDKYYATLMVIE